MSVTISTGAYNGYSANVTLYIPTGSTIPYNNVSATTENIGVKVLPFNYSGSSDIFEYGVFSCEMTGFSPSKICTTSLLTPPDGDGNTYKTIKIGNQIWMSENLKTTKFQDGTPLSNTSQVDNATWAAASASGSTKYWALANGTTANTQTYGLVYNHFAVSGSTTGATANVNLCPSGWHVPTAAEFSTLNTFIGTNAGTPLKSTTLWSTSTGYIPGTNSSGFNGLPAGARTGTGSYIWFSTNTAFKRVDTTTYFRLDFNSTSIVVAVEDGRHGYSVRCLKN